MRVYNDQFRSKPDRSLAVVGDNLKTVRTEHKQEDSWGWDWPSADHWLTCRNM